MSEEDFDCVFGYGKCPVRAHIRREQKELAQLAKVHLAPPEELPPELKATYTQIARFILTIIQQLFAHTGEMMYLGPFCQACPKLKKVNSH